MIPHNVNFTKIGPLRDFEEKRFFVLFRVNIAWGLSLTDFLWALGVSDKPLKIPHDVDFTKIDFSNALISQRLISYENGFLRC